MKIYNKCNVSKDTLSKIIAWLEDRDSHTIYKEPATFEKFTSQTGEPHCWPIHSVNSTRLAIANDPRGGSVEGGGEDQCSYGYEIAYALAEKYAGFRSEKIGRGFMFYDCLDALDQLEKEMVI